MEDKSSIVNFYNNKPHNLTPILSEKKPILKKNIASSSTLIRLSMPSTKEYSMSNSFRTTLPPIQNCDFQENDIEITDKIEEKILLNKTNLEISIAEFINNKCYYIYNDIVCSIYLKKNNNNHKFIYISFLSKERSGFEYGNINFNIYLLQETFDYKLIKDVIYFKYYVTCIDKYDILHGYSIKNISIDTSSNINFKDKINILRKNDLNKMTRKVQIDIEITKLPPLYVKMLESIDLYFFEQFINNHHQSKCVN
jgi:hypothetical protein